MGEDTGGYLAEPIVRQSQRVQAFQAWKKQKGNSLVGSSMYFSIHKDYITFPRIDLDA